jgi:hypothetical protein
MKSLALFLTLSLPLTSMSQGVFTNQTHSALQKVIGDYPNHFKNIKGEVLNEDPQSTDFSSKVEIPGSVNSVVTRYNSSPDKEIYSWKCLMTESEDFAIVSQLYKQLYDQLRNSIIKVEGEKPFILNGSYEIPTEEKKFTTSLFNLLPPTGDLRHLKVELTLEYYVTEWKVALLVYDQEEEVVMD